MKKRLYESVRPATKEPLVCYYFPRCRSQAATALRGVVAVRNARRPRAVKRVPEQDTWIAACAEVPGVEGSGATLEEAERDLECALDELAELLQAMLGHFTHKDVGLLRRWRAGQRRCRAPVFDRHSHP